MRFSAKGFTCAVTVSDSSKTVDQSRHSRYARSLIACDPPADQHIPDTSSQACSTMF